MKTKRPPKRRKNETDEEFKERYRKYIAEISKDINNWQSKSTELSEEQESWLAGKLGKNVQDGKEDEQGDEKQTQAEMVLQAATNNIQKLFVDEYKTARKINANNDHLETIPIRSRRFRNYLSSVVYNDCGMVINSQTLKDVIGVLSAKAEFDKSSEIMEA